MIDTGYLERFEHFSQRLNERYDIIINIDDYRLLNENLCAHEGLFSINENSTLIKIGILGKDVYTIYSKSLKLLITALPHDIESNLDQTLRACFKLSNIPTVSKLAEIIMTEINSERYDFQTDKDAAVYYFANCNYPTLLIEKFKFGIIRTIKICHEIRKILHGEHPRVELGLISKSKVKS